MKRILVGPGWVPAASLAAAIVLAAVVGGPGRWRVLRAESHTTGPCSHDPAKKEAPQARVCVADGVIGPVEAVAESDFSLDGWPAALSFSEKAWCTAKAKDGSISVRARTRDPGAGPPSGLQVQALVPSTIDSAAVWFTLTSGKPEDCCHACTLQAKGQLDARVAVRGPFDNGAFARAAIGRVEPKPGGGVTETPSTVDVELTFDQNCNGQLDYLKNKVAILLRLFCRRDFAAEPPNCIFFGFTQGTIQEIIDGTGIQYGPKTKDYFEQKRTFEGMGHRVHKPYGFGEEVKAFPALCEARVTPHAVFVEATSEVPNVAVRFPSASADLVFNTQQLSAEDRVEEKRISIEKFK
jgi:hypothetical protein